jgi:MscS family membrane protein
MRFMRLGCRLFSSWILVATIGAAAEPAPTTPPKPDAVPSAMVKTLAAQGTPGVSGDAVLQAMREPLKPVEGYYVLGLEAWRLIAAAMLLAVIFAISMGLRFLLRKSLKKLEETEKRQDVPLADLLLASLYLPAKLVAWSVGLRFLIPLLLAGQGGAGVWVWHVLMSVAVAILFYDLVEVGEQALHRYADRTGHRAMSEMVGPMLRKILRILVLLVAGLEIYNSVTGQSITTILAGLGLSGVAFALAAQDTLKNLFGFISLVADRPYGVGEWVRFGEHEGLVESVSLRSTRLRRFDGGLVTIPNSHAVSSVIHNVGRAPHFHRKFELQIPYDTPLASVERAVVILKEILADHEGMKPDFSPRVYFGAFGASGFQLLALYWYHPADYWKFLEFGEKVNFAILRRFREEGIEFAFPTQTLFLAGDPKRKIEIAAPRS